LNIFNSPSIPSPFKIVTAFGDLASKSQILTDFYTSIWRALLGLIIGSSAGIILGLLTGRNNKINMVLSPILNVFKAFPPVAMLPIFITFFGIGDLSKVFSISFATLFPLWVNTHIGASAIPIEYIRSAKLLSKSKSKILFKIIVPASMNSIIGGFRISIAISFIMLYVSELAGASSGLGYRISSSQLSYRYDEMFAALIILGITASSVDYIFNKVIKYFFPWVQLNKLM
jgi:ABC-type nitrate/sulfonate/bicarbonate transport system permease component